MATLLIKTPAAWLPCVLANFDSFLADHANAERKAAAMAMNLVQRYPDKPDIIVSMTQLAMEELQHFHDVYALMRTRKLSLQKDSQDAYVAQLRQQIRTSRQENLLDHLCVAGIIETRGCERFGLLAKGLPAGPLQQFYLELTRAEARHGGLFLRIAKEHFPYQQVEERVASLLTIERQLIEQLPIRPTIH